MGAGGGDVVEDGRDVEGWTCGVWSGEWEGMKRGCGRWKEYGARGG